MLLILLGLILALLPVILTTAFPHLIVISIYAGTLPWLALGWAILVITIIMRRQRITEWREKRKLNKKKKAKEVLPLVFFPSFIKHQLFFF